MTNISPYKQSLKFFVFFLPNFAISDIIGGIKIQELEEAIVEFLSNLV
jgi:hypothetical protein